MNTNRVDAAVRWSTAGVVVLVAAVAAFVSYQHAYEVVRAHGESAVTARLVPLTVDGLVFASSMVLLHCARYHRPASRLAVGMLVIGIAATLAANIMHGISAGAVGAVVAAWPAVALIGSYELLMWLVRAGTRGQGEAADNPEPTDSRRPDATDPDSNPGEDTPMDTIAWTTPVDSQADKRTGQPTIRSGQADGQAPEDKQTAALDAGRELLAEGRQISRAALREKGIGGGNAELSALATYARDHLDNGIHAVS